jgi:hypothetical protein
MADVEEPQYTTLAERIAALKQKNFNPDEQPQQPRKRPPPPPPPVRPASDARSKTAPLIPAVRSSPQTSPNPNVPPRPTKSGAPPPLPRRDTQNSTISQPETALVSRAAPPPLPSRTPSAQHNQPLAPPRPPLNDRRSSASSQLSIRSSTSASSVGYSLSSTTSNGSSGTARKVPPAFNPSTLPPLPPSKREREAQAQEAAAAEAAAANEAAQNRFVKTRELASRNSFKSKEPLIPGRSTAPAVLPPRPKTATTPAAKSPQPTAPSPAPPRRALPPRMPSRTSTPNLRGFASSQQDQDEPPVPPLPTRRPTADDGPPPVPMASRPSAAQIDAASARTAAPPSVPDNDCWICRDWSGPDGVAARFPRQSLPRSDPIGYLAHNLCSPFPSYTDKARAIFTWFHHNIAYDTEAFFGKTVKFRTAEDTLSRGLAVCGGYAETYKEIAIRAGLQCEMVVGHGKGINHTPLKAGQRPPPRDPSGHAWNAVRVDGGAWKLLDACWGAGHVSAAEQKYTAKFNPVQFIMPNDKFGWRHFPGDNKHQYRDDGRIMDWDEYMIGEGNGVEPPTVYGNAKEEGIDEYSIEPKARQVEVYSGDVVRFQFSKMCEHWKPEIHGLGKPPLLLLSIHGLDGRKDEMVPMETNGYWHWLDVNARDLGAPGQSVQVTQVTSMDGKDARGVTAREYLAKKGKVGMAFSFLVKWDLV